MTMHELLILLFYCDSLSRRKGSIVSLLKANCVFRNDKIKSQEQCGSQLASPAGPTERSLARTGFATEAEGNPVPGSPPHRAADNPAHRDRDPSCHPLTTARETGDRRRQRSFSRLGLSNWRELWLALRGAVEAKIPPNAKTPPPECTAGPPSLPRSPPLPPAPRLHPGA